MASERGKQAAYPTLPMVKSDGQTQWAGDGMTIREAFAKDLTAAAVSGSIAAGHNIDKEHVVGFGVALADALLAALAEEKP